MSEGSEDLRGSLQKQSSNSALTLDEKIQRKLNRESGGRRKGGKRRGELSFSLPPQSSSAEGGDADREAVRKALMEKRKDMPMTKHLSASAKMHMSAKDLAMLMEDSEEEDEAPPKGWECEKCTFLNENMDHLACSVCGAPRYNKG